MRVHGLQKKPEYNDLTGSVKREVEGGRWCIVLDKVGIELALKPDNFTQSELPKAAAEKGETVCANSAGLDLVLKVLCPCVYTQRVQCP